MPAVTGTQRRWCLRSGGREAGWRSAAGAAAASCRPAAFTAPLGALAALPAGTAPSPAFTVLSPVFTAPLTAVTAPPAGLPVAPVTGSGDSGPLLSDISDM